MIAYCFSKKITAAKKDEVKSGSEKIKCWDIYDSGTPSVKRARSCWETQY